jgi:transposase
MSISQKASAAYDAFANMVIDLSRFATIQDIAWFLDVSWDIVRNIQMEFLQKEYGSPDLSNLRYISIDEFATHKGQVYKTIVVDLKRADCLCR